MPSSLPKQESKSSIVKHESDDDDFIVIEDSLPLRPKSSNDYSLSLTEKGSASDLSTYDDMVVENGASIQLYPIPASGEVLVSITPPLKPEGELRHTNCDVVLVIDVSGSMGTAAELPDTVGSEQKEVSGLHILDLVRHAARTILEGLNENDRLAIVTFSTDACRVQDLTPMTATGKALAWKELKELQPDSSTNLWAGICEGLDVFNSNRDVGNVQSMLILTDGEPNYMCPRQGYVNMLQPMLRGMEMVHGRAPTLSTFGFGYSLRSDLMRSIAEVGRGSYAFIPDSGMIGTVFVHAIANLFSTFAISAKLSLQIQSRSGGISAPAYLDFETDQNEEGLVIHLERLQYGQSRDIVVKLNDIKNTDTLSCILEYRNVDKHETEAVSARCRLSENSEASNAYVNYHLARYELCNFLASLSTRNKNNEHLSLPLAKVKGKVNELEPIIQQIKNSINMVRKTRSSAEAVDLLESILADIENPDLNDNPHGSGQISLALQTKPPPSTSSGHQPTFYHRWGRHYLPSVLHAHMRQQCATFKDEGPLRYGSKSPLFIKCRDDLDRAFDKLPAPKPSLKGQKVKGGVLHMSRFHSRSNPCFAGQCMIKTASGGLAHEVRVDELMNGDTIWTPAGGRKIRGIVKTDVSYGEPQAMIHIADDESSSNGLWITPYHPVQLHGRWVFPIDTALNVPHSVMDTGTIYSILLEKDEDPNGHVINVGGILCVTLGHGIISDTVRGVHGTHESDVRAHPYFGDYDRVSRDLERLDKDSHGRRISAGVAKDEEGGLAIGFLRPDGLYSPVKVMDVRARL